MSITETNQNEIETIDLSTLTFLRDLKWSNDILDAVQDFWADADVGAGGVHFGLGRRDATEREFVAVPVHSYGLCILEVRHGGDGDVVLDEVEYAEFLWSRVRRLVREREKIRSPIADGAA